MHILSHIVFAKHVLKIVANNIAVAGCICGPFVLEALVLFIDGIKLMVEFSRPLLCRAGCGLLLIGRHTGDLMLHFFSVILRRIASSDSFGMARIHGASYFFAEFSSQARKVSLPWSKYVHT
jgi:hypothetical protein